MTPTSAVIDAPGSSSEHSTSRGSSNASFSYKPFPYVVEHVHIHISIYSGTTYITSTLTLSAGDGNCAGAHCAVAQNPPLVLDGWGLELLTLTLNGCTLSAEQYSLDTEGDTLMIHRVPNKRFKIEVKTAVHPEENTDYHALFARKGVYATQCEATGFSGITYFPDRPDLLALWSVHLEADESSCPVLLSNGHLKEQGRLPGGRHFTIWEDPWPKPCYLFSVVAGPLVLHEATYSSVVTGKRVALRIYVPEEYSGKTHFAMHCLQAALAWDELAYGRVYDLEVYHMVGVEGFNDEATETKGIGIFDAMLLAATPETHTDSEASDIQRLIAHEYFHNWSGNRVTVKDWCELTLKEGLTRFRDQEFAADLDAAAVRISGAQQCLAHSTAECEGSCHNRFSSKYHACLLESLVRLYTPASPGTTTAGAADHTVGSCQGERHPSISSWQRIAHAKCVRQDQFPEDDGPLQHPIRTTQGLSQDNLYSDTVYNKGAEVVRMYQTLLGPDKFTKHLSAFFSEFDGQATTCQTFCQAMCKPLGSSDSVMQELYLPMWRWYTTPGTPLLKVKSVYSPAKQRLTITTHQELEEGDQPLLIPVKIGLLGPDGQDLPLHLAPPAVSSSKKGRSKKTAASAATLAYQPHMITSTGLKGVNSHCMVLVADNWTNSFTFTRLPMKPAVSVLRDFTAPVRLEVEGETDKQLGFLGLHDSNPFARWDALQRLMSRMLVCMYESVESAVVEQEQPLDAALASMPGLPPALIECLTGTILDEQLDGQYRALMMELPSIDELIVLLQEPDPGLLWEVWVHAGQQLATKLEPLLQQVVASCDDQLHTMHAAKATAGHDTFYPPAVKARALRDAALCMMSFLDDKHLQEQFYDRYCRANCMTDRLSALGCLIDEDTPARSAALEHFYTTYAGQQSAVLKWLELQASSDIDGNVEHVRALMQHPAFDITNPASVEALLGSFTSSMVNFHAENGSGYQFLADAIMKVDKYTPAAAADLTEGLTDWHALDENAQQLMLEQLHRLAESGLSSSVREIVQLALVQQ